MGAGPGVVGQTEQTGAFGRGVVAGAELQALGAGELLVEVGVLVGREDRVAPGVAEHDGGAVGVDPVQIGEGGALLPPGDQLLLLGEVGGEEVRRDPLELLARPAGEIPRSGEHRGGLHMLGAAAVDGLDEVGPAAERRDRLDPLVVAGGQQTDARAVRDPGHADLGGVGGGVRQRPVDHLGRVGDVGRTGHLDLAARLPEAADVVTHHDIARVGELLGLREVLDLGQAPARGQHDHGVPARAVGAGGRDDIGLEYGAAVALDVDELYVRGGGLGLDAGRPDGGAAGPPRRPVRREARRRPYRSRSCAGPCATVPRVTPHSCQCKVTRR